MAKKIVIKRSKWVRGTFKRTMDESGYSLQTPQFCAIGFVLDQIGAYGTDHDREEADLFIQDAETTARLATERQCEWLLCPASRDEDGVPTEFSHSEDVNAIIDINDVWTDDGPGGKRESELKTIFARNGVELVFED